MRARILAALLLQVLAAGLATPVRAEEARPSEEE